MKLKKAKQ